MPDLIDLEKLDDDVVRRLRSAIRRYEYARGVRQPQTAAATAAAATAAKRRKAAGIKLTKRKPQLSKRALEQRARKAAATMRARYPERYVERPCRWCPSVARVRGQCLKHDQAWRRSGLSIEDWNAKMARETAPSAREAKANTGASRVVKNSRS